MGSVRAPAQHLARQMFLRTLGQQSRTNGAWQDYTRHFDFQRIAAAQCCPVASEGPACDHLRAVVGICRKYVVRSGALRFDWGEEALSSLIAHGFTPGSETSFWSTKGQQGRAFSARKTRCLFFTGAHRRPLGCFARFGGCYHGHRGAGCASSKSGA